MSPGLYRLMYRVGLSKEVSGIVLSRSFNCSQGNRRAVVLAITALSQQGCLPWHQNVEEPMYQMFETNNQGTHVMPCIWQHCLNSLFILQISCEQFLNPWCWAPQPAIAPIQQWVGRIHNSFLLLTALCQTIPSMTGGKNAPKSKSN